MPDPTHHTASDPRLGQTPTADVTADAGHNDSTTADTLPPAVPGYDLLGEVGHGGMGVVYRARDLTLDRDVAVKVLRNRFATGSATARRFDDEARITAQLQHPGIPAVHQVGRLQDGRPFLAMKLVRGQTLDEELADRLDATADRGRFVAIFERVCQAVAYALAHCVVHRDLKPANVMVGAYGEVQVMDWGLAKVLTPPGQAPGGHRSADETTAATAIVSLRDSDASMTQAGSVLGTPSYMSPEQAIGAVDRIDERTDVFGLGGILCAILTGRPPYVGDDLESTRQLAARAKLSETLARLDGCGAEPDLVALAKRCLAAEPDDRPRDADEVARVVAGLRTAAEERARQAELSQAQAAVRAAEQRKRRRSMLAAAAALIAVLTTGGGLAFWQWQRADRALGQVKVEQGNTEHALAQKTAEQQRTADALTEAETARSKTLSTLRKLTDEAVKERAGRQATLTATDRAYFRDVQTLWEDFAATRGDTPEARELRAEGIYRVAVIRHGLGELEDAATAYRTAISRRKELTADFPDVPRYRGDLAATHNSLGNVLGALGRPEDAATEFRAALAIQENLAKEPSLGPKFRNDLSHTYHSLGALLDRQGEPADAEKMFRAGRRVLEGLVAEVPDEPNFRRDLAANHNSLGMVLSEQNRIKDAVTEHKASVTTWEKLAADFPDDPEYRRGLANAHNGLGLLLGRLRRTDEAGTEFRAAHGLLEQLTADFPAVAEYATSLGGTYCNYGQLIAASKSPSDALPWYDKAVATLDPVVRRQPKLETARHFLQNSLWGRAQMRMAVDRYAESAADWDRVIELDDGDRQQGFRMWRALCLARTDPARAAEEADELAKEPQIPAEALYDLACVFGVASARVPKEVAEKYAGKAVALLRRAVRAGWKDGDHMIHDPDLAPIQSRSDFRNLVAELGVRLPELPPPPRLVK